MESHRPRRLAWLISVIAWDGVLPLFVAGGAILVAALEPKPRGIVVPLAATFIPLAALIVRGVRGFRDLASFSQDRFILLRKLAFCLGLFQLLTIEAVSSVLFLDGLVGPGGGFLVFFGGMYSIYLLLMAIAFRP